MIFQIVGKGIFSIINNIVMAEKIVTFEVIRGKDVIEGI